MALFATTCWMSQARPPPSDASCRFMNSDDTQSVTNARFEALDDLGGPTLTRRAPPRDRTTSECLPVAGCDARVTADQRGEPRPADGNGHGTSGCDLITIELHPEWPGPPTLPLSPPSGPGAGA